MKLKRNPQETQIFKVQRPICSSENDTPILIYNKDRSIYHQMPISQEMAKFIGTSYKIYVKGYINSEGILQIVEKVGNQPW